MASGRIYRAVMDSVAVTAQQDFFEINSSASRMTEILEVHLSQVSEVGDAAEEGLAILYKSGQTTSGSSGSSTTAIPTNIGDAAYGGTCEINNTVKATAGTIVTHASKNWNIRVPFDDIFVPGTEITLIPSGRFVVQLATTPADSVTVSGYVVIRELG